MMRGSKFFFMLMFSTLLLVSQGAAQEAPFRSVPEFNRWITHYYLAPEPQRISNALRFYCNSTLFEKESTRGPMAVFFASIFRNNPAAMTGVYEDISLHGSEKQRIFALNCLWLVHNAAGEVLLQRARQEWTSKFARKILQEMKGKEPGELFDRPIRDPVQLDMLWARFSATGDPDVVQKILSYIPLKEKASALDVLLEGTLTWSLARNAQQHPVVYEICKEELMKSSGSKKKLLEEIISNSKTSQPNLSSH